MTSSHEVRIVQSSLPPLTDWFVHVFRAGVLEGDSGGPAAAPESPPSLSLTAVRINCTWSCFLLFFVCIFVVETRWYLAYNVVHRLIVEENKSFFFYFFIFLFFF